MWSDPLVAAQCREWQQTAHHRIRTLLGMEDVSEKSQDSVYGLGKVRSLAEYETYCSVHFKTQTIQNTRIQAAQ
jgi:hypothetical protein